MKDLINLCYQRSFDPCKKEKIIEQHRIQRTIARFDMIVMNQFALITEMSQRIEYNRLNHIENILSKSKYFD